jgi:hypothetical protein
MLDLIKIDYLINYSFTNPKIKFKYSSKYINYIYSEKIK